MKRDVMMAATLLVALSLPLAGCAGGSGDAGNGGAVGAPDQQESSFDAVSAYYGQWRGSVATTETTIYGNAGGTETMLDIFLNEDGSCSVEPLASHADLPSDKGTWEGTEDQVVMHLSAGDVVLTVVDSVTLEGPAADFGIADFEVVNFNLYG